MGSTLSVDSDGIVLYSLTYCPYCNKAKAALKRNNIRVTKVYELDTLSNRQQMQDMLKTTSGVNTVPQLYVNGKFIGGSDEIVEWAAANSKLIFTRHRVH